MGIDIKKEKRSYFVDNFDYIKCLIFNNERYCIWKYLYYLHKEENTSNTIGELFWRRKKNIKGNKIGFSIGAGVFGQGLKIWHVGSVIVNSRAKIGGIEIADDIVIAAGAVVNKSFTEKGITKGGIPARKYQIIPH